MANETGVRMQALVDYYDDKLREHGATPKGVDWNGEASQQLRFRQLAKIIAPGRPATITDLGCGYGALAEFLDGAGIDCHYLGVDASADMVAAARERLRGRANTELVVGNGCVRNTDYVVASGIFNCRLHFDDAAWFDFITATIDDMVAHADRAVAFNCLTIYSDADRMRDDLYYSDPCRLFDYCKRKHSRDVALWHDYGAYEFTIVVRKEPA